VTSVQTPEQLSLQASSEACKTLQEPHISVIVPVYNSGKTLDSCLQSVYASDYKDFEVILVNDASTDDSMEVVRRYPCKSIEHKSNTGSGVSKNDGAHEATGKILLFIDSDVIVAENVLSVIHEIFQNNVNLAAVCAIPDSKNPYCNFASQYKTLYMNYIFSGLPDKVDFLHGCVHAFNKEVVFKENNVRFHKHLYCNDIDTGLTMKELGMDILLSRDLKIVHMKYHNLVSLLKNDFLIPSDFVQIMLKHRSFMQSAIQKRFAHTRLQQVLAVAMAPLVVIMTLITWAQGSHALLLLTMGLVLIYVVLNFSFYRFNYSRKGLTFLIRSMVFNVIDQIVMALGMLTGAWRGIVGRVLK